MDENGRNYMAEEDKLVDKTLEIMLSSPPTEETVTLVMQQTLEVLLAYGVPRMYYEEVKPKKDIVKIVASTVPILREVVGILVRMSLMVSGNSGVPVANIIRKTLNEIIDQAVLQYLEMAGETAPGKVDP